MTQTKHRNTKHTFKAYAAWDFGFEAEELNRMSEKGWQLVKGGCFHQTYVFDDSVVYRYQIDFHNQIPNMARYDETFRDAGWERVSSTFNDWHIFRKVYDPSLPQEEYEIYTDTASQVEMLKRWRRTALISALVMVATGIQPVRRALNGAFHPIGDATLLLLYGLMAWMEINAFRGIHRLIKGVQNKRPFPIRLSIGLLLLLLAVFILSSLWQFRTGNSPWMAAGMLLGMGVACLVGIIAALIGKRKY